jgi:hypothetical protein
MERQRHTPEQLVGRAIRMQQAVPRGPELYRYLAIERRADLIEAADRGVMPLTAVSAGLLDTFGATAVAPATVKRFLGLVCSAILAEAGFQLAKTGTRVRADPVFVSGAVYRRNLERSHASPSPLLKRLIDSLSDDELSWAASYIRERIQHRD